MTAHQRQWPVSILWEGLDGGRSGYYAYVARHKASRIDAEARQVRSRLPAIHPATGQRDGSRRMAQQLQAEGFAVGRSTVRRFMKEGGVEVKRRSRRRPQTTESRHGSGVAPNLLERRLEVDRAKGAWGGDMTSLWTEAGWLSLSVRWDVSSRQVVGWARRDHLATPLVTHALPMA